MVCGSLGKIFRGSVYIKLLIKNVLQSLWAHKSTNDLENKKSRDTYNYFLSHQCIQRFFIVSRAQLLLLRASDFIVKYTVPC